MTKNVGQTDKIIRIVLGALLLILAFAAFGGGLKWLAAIVGLVLIGTGLMNTCPAYSLLGVNTCKLEHKSGT